jgi:hypothetical protein
MSTADAQASLPRRNGWLRVAKQQRLTQKRKPLILNMGVAGEGFEPSTFGL